MLFFYAVFDSKERKKVESFDSKQLIFLKKNPKFQNNKKFEMIKISKSQNFPKKK